MSSFWGSVQILGGHHPATLTRSIQDGTQMTLTILLRTKLNLTTVRRHGLYFWPTYERKRGELVLSKYSNEPGAG